MKDPRPYPKSQKKDPTPGEIPEHRIPIHDHKGNVRGHVGRTATSATVARFLGHHGAKLGMKDGRQAWIGEPPPPPPPPPALPGMPPMEAARGEAEIGLIQAKTHALSSKSGASKPDTKSKVKKPGAK